MRLFHVLGLAVRNGIVLLVCVCIVYVGYKGNQPMTVDQAPKEMTYFEFMSDRYHAAQSVKPARCGWGMMLSLAALGPIYSLDYTWVATHPDGFLAKVTAPDPDIPRNDRLINFITKEFLSFVHHFFIEHSPGIKHRQDDPGNFQLGIDVFFDDI